MLRVALAAGGTAGHVFPAVAVADALLATGLAVETHFLGTPAGLERTLLGRIGREVTLIPGLPFQCRGPLARVQSLLTIPPSVARARRVLRELHVDVVVGFGGYASIGPLLAAKTLGLRTAIVDGNAQLGLANRILAPLADRRFIGATPLRSDIVAVAKSAVRSPRDRVNVVVFGDDFLDARAPALLRGIATHVVHRSAHTDAAEIRRAYGPDVHVDVVVHADDVAALYRQAHFVIARGGASTLAELAVTGRPSLIVPLRGASANHQLDNAAPYGAAGAALVAEESSLDASAMRDAIAGIVLRPHAWRRMSNAARSLARPDAAQNIARELLTFAASSLPPYEISATTSLEGAAR